MTVLDKTIDVICVFYENEIPEPRKFKIKYRNGEVKTVNIDLVRRHESIHPNGLHFIVYSCQSEVEDKIISYELKYMVKEMKWVLHRVF